MNVAVIHDGSAHPGGAVDVVTEAATALEADLYVGYSGVDREWWERRVPGDVTVLTDREASSTLTDALVAWECLRLDLREYDAVLSSGPAAKFFQPYDDQRITHYLHHPPLGSLWFDGNPLDYAIKTVDRIETWSKPTLVANSDLTADRMAAHYDRRPDAVVYPPVDVERFSPDRDRERDRVVMVGRLEERKRPELAVKAFRRLQRLEPVPQLDLVGDGPLRERIERLAPENVAVHGYVADDRLTELVERAYAGLFLARREDFGITPVEYMAAGTPVVGVDEPNTSNQVTDGETGVLVAPDAEAVADGVKRALSTAWDRAAIREGARAYDTERFHERIREVVA